MNIRLAAALLAGILIGVLAPHQFSTPGRAAGAGTFAAFAQPWFFHDGGIHITASGQGFLSYRTFTNCTLKITTNCDYVNQKKGVIYNGGFATFKLTRAQGDHAWGEVTNSGASWQVGTPVTVVLRASNDTLAAYFAGGGGPQVACGPRAPAGFCGA